MDTAEAYGFGTSERQTRWAAEQAGVKIGCGEGEVAVLASDIPVWTVVVPEYQYTDIFGIFTKFGWKCEE